MWCGVRVSDCILDDEVSSVSLMIRLVMITMRSHIKDAMQELDRDKLKLKQEFMISRPC